MPLVKSNHNTKFILCQHCIALVSIVHSLFMASSTLLNPISEVFTKHTLISFHDSYRLIELSVHLCLYVLLYENYCILFSTVRHALQNFHSASCTWGPTGNGNSIYVWPLFRRNVVILFPRSLGLEGTFTHTCLSSYAPSTSVPFVVFPFYCNLGPRTFIPLHFSFFFLAWGFLYKYQPVHISFTIGQFLNFTPYTNVCVFEEHNFWIFGEQECFGHFCAI